MAGKKERYSVQFEDGTIRSLVAMGYKNAKDIFICRYSPPKGTYITVWPQSNRGAKRRMKIT